MSNPLEFGGAPVVIVRDKGTPNAVSGFVTTEITITDNDTALPTSFELESGDASASLTLQTNTLVWIKVSGVWKLATPYIKVAGVWKQATPYVKVSGTWR